MSSKGGSGSTGSSYSTSQTILPQWLSDASQNAVQYSTEISKIPYQAYGGQMVADVPTDTLQAYQQVRDLQGAADPTFAASQNVYSGLLGQAQPLTTDQINQMSNQLYGNYGANVVAPTAGLLGNYLQNAGPATAEQVGQNAMQLMNPYAQSVINPTLKIAQQQLAQQYQDIAKQAGNVGAFGGSRQGVQEGVAGAQSVLGTEANIGKWLSEGYNAAMTPAYNLANQASQQGYGAAGLLAGQLGTGYQNAQQQAQGMAGTNLQAGLQAAQNAPALALQQQAQRQKEASMLQTIGAAQQNQQQALLDQQIGQWYEQQQYPYQQLDTLLSAVGSVPYGSQTTSYGTSDTSKKTSSNTAASAAGGALSGAATGSMFGPWGTAIGAVGGGILGALN